MKQTAVEWFWIHLEDNISKKYFDLFEQAKEMEKQQSDDYAIEFAEWLVQHKDFNKSKSTKELLEIFKKENNENKN
jgi:hypothetical protein